MAQVKCAKVTIKCVQFHIRPNLPINSLVDLRQVGQGRADDLISHQNNVNVDWTKGFLIVSLADNVLPLLISLVIVSCIEMFTLLV